uniref:Leucine-rich repeat protein n=1 Tax=viral metagenome TaxID=1070528 RepID=A0A6C0DVP9_9ZZZZ
MSYTHKHHCYGENHKTFVRDIERLISKRIVDYNIEYTDPNNFIYHMNKKSMYSIIKKDGTHNIYSVYNLYMNFYNNKIIDCKSKSIKGKLPYYPKLEILDCTSNQITELPSYPVIREIKCNDNLLTEIGNYPILEVLNCNNNRLTKLPYYPNLKTLLCHTNCITELPSFPNIKVIACASNEIITIGECPNLTYLNCFQNKLKHLNDYPKLQTLICEDNLTLGKYPVLEKLFNGNLHYLYRNTN